ncbi:MAG: replication protein [Devosia sp.]|nr:replication protein [Devosia sp.]
MSANGAGDAFLEPHHLAAAERLERLILRAQLMPRVTMSYDTASAGGGSRGTNSVEAGSDSAAEARQKLNRLAGMLPPDCWGVLIDCYGLGKGLQVIETERRWPRRSAKLVLRIGLDQLAAQFGLTAQAKGGERVPAQSWVEQRLPLIAGK